MATSTIRQRASCTSWILLVGLLGAGCLAEEPDPNATTTEDLSDSIDLTLQDSTNDDASFEEASELVDDSGGVPFRASAAADAPIEIAAPAPTCVVLSIDRPGIFTKTVRLHNACSHRVRVRVDLSFQPDLPCISLAVGQRNHWKVLRSTVVAGVKNC